jgi:hypothetical protein
MSDDVYDFTRRVVHQYMMGRSLVNLIFYHDATPEERSAIRMTCQLIAKRLSQEQIDDIRQHAQIDLQNPEIPAKSWVVELARNPKPRPAGPTFVIGNIRSDPHDCYDEITTAGDHLPDARPWKPDKPRFSLRERMRLAVINVARRL